MAAPEFATAGSLLSGTSSGTAAVPVPSGVAAGDLILVTLYLEANRTVTAPAGFTLLPGLPVATSIQWHYVYWKRATGGDTGTYSFTFTSTYRLGAALRITGAVASGDPIDVFDQAGRASNGTVTPAVSVTTTGPDRLLVWFGTDFSTGSWTPPTGYTTRVAGSTEITGATRTQAAAGSSGSVTGTSTGSNQQTAVMLAVSPADVAVDVEANDSVPAGILHGSPTGESVEALSINLAVDTDPTAATITGAPGGETVSVDLTDPTPAGVVHGAAGGELVSVAVDDAPPAVTMVGSPTGETIDAEEPGLPAGGAPFVSLWAIDPDTGGLIRLPHALNVDLSPVRNQAGAFRFDYPAFGRNFDVLHDRLVGDQVSLELELWVGGSRFNALGGDILRAEGDDVAEDSVWTFSGKFLTHRLARATVVHDPSAEKGERRFGAATAGTIMRTFLQEAQARGTLTELSFATFSATHDSAGVPWARTVTLKFTPYGNGGLLSVLARLVDLGLCEGEVDRDKRLLLYNAGGAGRDLTTRTPPTILRRGKDLLESNRRIDVEEAGTDLFGTGAEGLYASTFDATARAKWDVQIEKVIDSNQIEDQAALTAFVQNARESAVLAPMELTHGLVFGSNRPAPVSGFRINDWLYSDVGRGLERVRVAQWVLSQDVSGITGSVTLNDVIADRLTRLARRLNAMSDGSAVVGTSDPSTSGDGLVPAAPTGVTVDSLAYTEGIDTYATLLVGWNQVTTNASGPATPKAQAAQLILERMQSGQSIAEDWTWPGMPSLVGVWNDALLADFEASGSGDAETWLAGFVAANSVTGTAADDIAGYRVQWRPQSEGVDSWRLGIEVAGGSVTSTSFGGVGAGIDVLVRVAAYDRDGNQSAWSSEVVILTATDDTAPPTPSTPGAFPYLGQIKVTYDGKGSAGEAMPLDTAFVELHKSLASAFTPTAATAVDTFSPNIAGERVLTDLAYGVAVFVRLVAVDRAGNRSAASTQASATPEKVVGDDVFDGAIGSAKLADLAAITAKIDNLAVNDAKFGSGSVGKLTAGVLNVAVTNAGIVRSDTTGQRYELDAAGLRFYNGSGTQTVQLNGAFNWILGEFRTAMTGTRMVINPGGTDPDEMRFYPSSGSAFAKLETRTFEGQALIDMIGGTTRGDGATGQVGCHPLEGYIRWGLAESTAPRSFAIARERALELSGPDVIIAMNERFAGDFTPRRIHFEHRDSNGNTIQNSRLYLRRNGDNGPWFQAPNPNSGVVFQVNAIGIVDNSGNAQTLVCSSVSEISSEEAKGDIRDARAVLDPLKTIRASRSQAFEYLTDRVRKPPPTADDPDPDPVPVPPEEVPTRFGPIAEDLPPELQETITLANGSTVLGTSLNAKVGVIWGALGQMQDQEIRTVAGRAALPNGTYQPGTVREVAVAWDETPLEVPTGGIVTVYAAIAWLGKTTARIVPGSLTATGCIVEVRALAQVVPNAANPVTVEAQALYLYAPPYAPPPEDP